MSSVMGVCMDEGTECGKAEDVVGSHVEDAITFWAQNISSCNDLLKLSCVLAEACPRAQAAFGKLDFNKIYGGCFSEDRCWYRCVVQRMINNEKCQVLYIDYGNSEIINRSEIVEIPENLQYPSVAKKYRLWGLRLPADQNLNMFDQGKTFLGSLVFEKAIKVRQKAKQKDDTILVQAECEKVDIGEEVAKAGFAEKYRSPGSTEDVEKREDAVQNQCKKMRAPAQLWVNKPGHALCNRPRVFLDPVAAPARNEVFAGNRMILTKDKTPASAPVLNRGLACVRDQNLAEENDIFEEEKGAHRKENLNLLRRQKELELEVEHLKGELQIINQEKEASRKRAEHLEETLHKYIGTKMRDLAANVKVLKEIRHAKKSAGFGEQLSQAIKLVTEGNITVPCSLEKLQKLWTEYDLAQEVIRLCENVDERDELITKRNEVQQNLYSVVKEFILEVDQLFICERSNMLQELSVSLEMIYGQVCEVNDSEEVFQQFLKWKCAKIEEFIDIRNHTDAALRILTDLFSSILKCFDLSSEAFSDIEEVPGNVDEALKEAELCICKELKTDLTEHDEKEKGIIKSAYSKVMQKVCQEQDLITVIQKTYLASVEFKKEAEQWLNRTPNSDNLLSIKKAVKSLKAQLRWKLTEKNNTEESDDYSELEITRIKEEIAALRNKLLQEIYREQEEYEKLAYLVQKWFPELPLLYPEAGILSYMNSGGLLSHSLERDLLDAEPMKKLSTKRPLVCSEIQDQKVLLKGYSVDVSSEAKVIERVAKYHRAWDQQKEKSSLLQLLFLLFCKSDPLVYLMVPYYPGASLTAVQADAPLTLEETLKVMKGVAQGLQTLHGANIVHGSLHGNNVFAVNRKQGIVGDFDFTKSEEQRAAADTMVIGTLSLVSPELKMGQPASPASDMYAYGCLLFWLCIQNQEFGIKEDGTPEVDAVGMDDKVKSLILNLFRCDRLTAEQVLRDDCFLLADAIPVPSQLGEEHEPPKEHDSEKTDEEEDAVNSEKNAVNPTQ
ncbi:serine/threonine-protein kinase 31 isoform X1 [Gallus gallus]|uniref:serine/threonine-protein kinase 31 isoform X1 n=2 Tax=Gallus gallus TaxID=9031 RepID=UPI001AE37B77|nr:serine/threonine-protein kinase 31 isoform X1 [Gallus gallus]XP_040552541.1 serine/threonine-protein kinase 31 isoform X1 [Gallus gallus]XP_040552542.1 serine/threonine-protein kinase 31 isoform X1 [Gallus gallus]XP_040552546.1 serine/threonine-protein kinase 31 isoform X1 [Gallus gallus]